MIDFIAAGVMYLGVMFFVCFCFSFITIGLSYIVAALAKGFINRLRQPQPVLK